MRQFTLELDENNTRPIVMVHGGLQALVDTGAEIPICTLSETTLRQRFNAVLALNDEVDISGVGGKSVGRIFILNCFVLGQLRYPNLKIFVPNYKIISQHFLVPASMLSGLIYEIDDIEHRMTIKVPDGENMDRYPGFDKNGEHFTLLNDNI